MEIKQYQSSNIGLVSGKGDDCHVKEKSKFAKNWDIFISIMSTSHIDCYANCHTMLH